MTLVTFFVRCIVYIACFAASWYGLGALHYEKLLRQNHVKQAQVLYALLCMGLAYVSGSFLLAFLYR